MVLTNGDIVVLLNRCDWTQFGEKSLLEEITPKGVKVVVDSHSTAKCCHIYLTLDGEPDLLVWYKTNWISSNYEINEKGKTSGIQPNCEFAKPLLSKLFQAASDHLSDIDRIKEEKKLSDASKKKEERESLVARYQERFGHE